MTKTQQFARHDHQPPSAEEAIRYEILESINSLVVVLDEELTIIHANDQWRDFVELQGIPADVAGVHYLDLLLETKLIFGEQIADVASRLQQTIANTIQDFDFYCLNHSVQKRSRLKIHAELLRVDDKVRLLICHDISDETYIASQEKTDLIQLMISGVSHNVNDLLASIQNNCERLKPEIQSNIRANTILMRIFDSINSAPKLTEKFLLYSQATGTELEDVQLDEIINNVIDSFRETLPPTTKVKTQFEQQKYIIQAETLQVCQFLMHMFDNSKYAIAGKAGCISVTLQPSINGRKMVGDESNESVPSNGVSSNAVSSNGVSSNGVSSNGVSSNGVSSNGVSSNAVAHIRIEDNGRGMDEETLEHCFEPFYTTKPFGYSNGLGLSMVRRTIINLGGHIVVTSKSGIGTIFDIYLPCIKVEPAPSPG